MNKLDTSKSKRKVKLVVKNKIKIEKKLELKYPSTKLNEEFLDYDYDDKDELKPKNKFNLEIINSLPKLLDESENFEKMDKSDKQDEFEEEILSVENIINNEIDDDELEIQLIGENKYYMDYNKGNIYDINKNLVGMIDDYGEIQIYT